MEGLIFGTTAKQRRDRWMAGINVNVERLENQKKKTKAGNEEKCKHCKGTGKVMYVPAMKLTAPFRITCPYCKGTRGNNE